MATGLNCVRDKLNAIIDNLNSCTWLCAKDPQRNFTRNRKLPLSETIKILLCMEGGSLKHELLEHFHFCADTASSSALVQQRSKIESWVFPFILHSFVRNTDHPKMYKGYRLLAADGSDIHIPTNPKEKTSYFPGTNGQSPYNLLHLDALYDLSQETYWDAEIVGKREANETESLCRMVDRSNLSNVLLLADRGYERYNLLAHIQEKHWNFLIRGKDIRSNGIASGLELPSEDTFDVPVTLSLTNKQSNKTKALFKQKNRYKLIPSHSNFDFLPATSRKYDPAQFYTIAFRAVRFELSPGNYEVILTNLDAEHFPPLELKKLYAMRWGIETSFRDLKYTLGLLQFHAKKVEYIHQEIFARLIMYNFSRLVISKITIPDKKGKYDYKINFSIAVQISRQFFRGCISPPVIEAILLRNLSSIRPERRNPRNMSPKHAASFTYRVA